MNSSDDNSVRAEWNISISMGHGDILEEIKQQVHDWAATRDSRALRIPPDIPIAFVFLVPTWVDSVAVPHALPRDAHRVESQLFYQVPVSHIGRFMEDSAILRDEALLRHLRNASIPRVASESVVVMRGVETRYTLIHDKASVLLSQLCSSTMSSIRVWTQRPRYQHVIFVHLEIPEGFEILLKAPGILT